MIKGELSDTKQLSAIKPGKAQIALLTRAAETFLASACAIAGLLAVMFDTSTYPGGASLKRLLLTVAEPPTASCSCTSHRFGMPSDLGCKEHALALHFKCIALIILPGKMRPSSCKTISALSASLPLAVCRMCLCIPST